MGPDGKKPFACHHSDRVWVSCEAARSIAYKITYPQEKSLAGVMIWHPGGNSVTLLETRLAGQKQRTQFELFFVPAQRTVRRQA